MPKTPSPETVLKTLFQRNGTKFRWQVKDLLNPRTDRPMTVDFYLPRLELYVEAKGQFTLEAIERLMDLVDHPSRPRVYLYSHHSEYRIARLEDWPVGTLSDDERNKIDRASTLVEEELEPYGRKSSGKHVKSVLEGVRALQQEELLAMSRNPELAVAATEVTRARLKRYAGHMAIRLNELRLIGPKVDDWP